MPSPVSQLPQYWATHGDTATAMRAAGSSYADIAAATGTSYATARSACRLYLDGKGAKPRPAPAPAQPQVAPEGSEVALEVTGSPDGSQSVLVRSQTIRTLDGLLEAAEVDTERWSVAEHKASKWDAQSVDRRTGEVRVIELWQVKARLVPNVERLIERCPPVPFWNLERPTTALPVPADEVCVLIPDTQHGFRWRENYTQLEPMHDSQAIDAVRQLCELLQPGVIGLLGDHFDATAWSHYRTGPSERYTSQPAINALAWELLETRRVCPRSRMIYVGGNHDERPEYRIAEQMGELAATKPVGTEAHPYSMRGLLRLDDMRIEYVPYKDGFWLWDDLEITHEDGIDPMKAMAKRAHSLVQGHTHRLMLAQRTIWGPQGRRVIYACSPGTLARVDAGAVPGVKPRQDWQQGVAVAMRVGSQVHLQVVPIVDGCLVWGGVVIEGRDRSSEQAAFAGFPQIAAWRST